MTNTPDKIVLRSWPKLVFCWPTAISALACGASGIAWPEHREWQGAAFLLMFASNMLVLSFEFGRAASLAGAFATMALGAGAVLLNQQYGFIGPLSEWIAAGSFWATPEFYFALGGTLCALLAGMFFVTRFDYWVLSPNELVHKKGLLGDLERFPTNGLKLNKEIDDIFEYLIARAGRIVLVPSGPHRPIVLENVIGIQRIERQATELLSASLVRLADNDSQWAS